MYLQVQNAVGNLISNKVGQAEQSVKVGKGQQMTLVLKRGCHDERL